MTTTTPAGWYPDQTQPGSLRYWDGATWTAHSAPDPAYAVVHPIKPGLVPVWITAVLSLFTVYFRSVDASGSTTTISIPVGVVFLIICWRLVARAGQCARSMGVPLPGGYQAAKITSAILAGISVLGSIATSLG